MDDLYARGKINIASRMAAMWAGLDLYFIGCSNRGEEGHFQQNCRKPRNKGHGKNTRHEGNKGRAPSKGGHIAKTKKGGKDKKWVWCTEALPTTSLTATNRIRHVPRRARSTSPLYNCHHRNSPGYFCLRHCPIANECTSPKTSRPTFS